jgi:hypothetical protein
MPNRSKRRWHAYSQKDTRDVQDVHGPIHKKVNDSFSTPKRWRVLWSTAPAATPVPDSIDPVFVLPTTATNVTVLGYCYITYTKRREGHRDRANALSHSSEVSLLIIDDVREEELLPPWIIIPP